MLKRWVIVVLALPLAYCAHEKPPPQPVAQVPPPPPVPPPAPQGGVACPDTQPGNGCATLKFSVTESVRRDAKVPVRGNLYWALYRSGDVGAFGPGKHQPVLSGQIPDVDLNGPGATTEVNLPDISAHKYKPLAYIDVRDSHSGTADHGDPVTLPHHSIEITPGAHADIPVVFDFIR